MRGKKPKSRVIVLQRDMLQAEAFRGLTKTSILILLDFLGKRQMEKVDPQKRDSEYQIKNNGRIIYTYREAGKKGVSKASFQRSIDQLIDRGFLSVARAGAGVERAATLYSIDERWKEFGTTGFKTRKRPRKARWTGPVGFQMGHPKYEGNGKSENVITFNNGNTGTTENGNTGTYPLPPNGNTEKRESKALSIAP